MAKKTAVKEKTTASNPDLEVMSAKDAVKGQLVAMAPGTTAYVQQIMTPELVKSLTHVRPEVFERNLFNAIAANPKLLEQQPFFVYREVSKAAALNLLLDPLLGEAYIIEAWDAKKNRKIPQLRIGYKGFLKLARMSGNVAGVWCHEIYEKDKVTVDLGHPKVFHHEPKLFSDRGKIIGYAAVIAFKDGSFDFEPMSLEECLKIRDRSDAWKAYTAKKIFSTPWSTDENEMCKKTTFRRLTKRQDMSQPLRDAIAIEDAAEHPEMIEAKAITAPAQPKLRPPAPPPEDPFDSPKNHSLKNDDPSPVRAALVPGKSGKPAKKSRAPAPKKADPGPDHPQAFTKLQGKELIAYAKKICDGITPEMLKKDDELFDTVWETMLAPHLEGGFPPDVGEVQGIFNKMVARLSP